MRTKASLLFLLSLLLFGCGERHATQTPLQLTYGNSTQSNANMNYQPSIVVGNQPLGKDSLLAALKLDVQEKEARLTSLEEKANQEITLPGDRYFVSFAPPLNTSVFAAMRVAYPKEFLELDNTTRTSLTEFYDALDSINASISQRNIFTHTPLTDSKQRIIMHDKTIIEGITSARNAAKTFKR